MPIEIKKSNQLTWFFYIQSVLRYDPFRTKPQYYDEQYYDEIVTQAQSNKLTKRIWNYYKPSMDTHQTNKLCLWNYYKPSMGSHQTNKLFV